MAESYNICLDIGGTKILGVIFNSKPLLPELPESSTRTQALFSSHQTSLGGTTISKSPSRKSSALNSISATM